MADGDFVKVGALWIKEKNDRKYMSGKIEKALPAGTQVFIYKNDRKQNDKHPDYTLHAILEEDYSPPEPDADERETFF